MSLMLESREFLRCIVVGYKNEINIKRLQLNPVLSNIQLKPKDTIQCVLKGKWAQNHFNINDFVHLFCDFQLFKDKGFIEINDCNGFIVKNPDQLVSVTSILATNYCIRKEWLSNKFNTLNNINKEMLIGDIIHQLFGQSCVKRLATKEDIEKLFRDNILIENRTNIYSSGFSERDVIDFIVDKVIPNICLWISDYLFKMSPIIDQLSNNINNSNSSELLRINEVIDIEDMIWDIKYGLKGKIDLTVNSNIDVYTNGVMQTNATNFLMPLELKTGSAKFDPYHIGQVQLYLQMFDNITNNSSNDEQSNGGLLVYINGDNRPQMRRILKKKNEQQDLMILRNNLVQTLENQTEGPEPIIGSSGERKCLNCEMLTACVLYLKGFDKTIFAKKHNSLRESYVCENVLKNLNDQQLSREPSEVEMKFFQHWIELITLEKEAIIEEEKELFWSLDSNLCESRGLGFGSLQIIEQIVKSDYSVEIILVRSNGNGNLEHINNLDHFSVMDSLMKKGDTVVLSSETNVSLKYTFGKIILIDETYIRFSILKKATAVDLPVDELYRLDKFPDSGSNIKINYTNILRLIVASDTTIENLRSLIIYSKEARAKAENKSINSNDIITHCKDIVDTLNSGQQASLFRALTCDSHHIITGMPGTGKTQTIVATVRTLVKLRHSVLISCHTHAAIDNVLLKLKEHNVDFLRIGPIDCINSGLHEYTVHAKTGHLRSAEELGNYYSKINVVAVTCLAVANYSIFKRKTNFDFCIIDEASQVLLPTSLGPLFCAKRFILVGDSKQLPPVVRSDKSKAKGLDVSLFLLLQDKRLKNHTELTVQYRMNNSIMSVANKLTYENKLSAGNLQIANQTVNCLQSISEENRFVRHVLSPDLNRSVLFIDTINFENSEDIDYTGSISNNIEIQFVLYIVEICLKYIVNIRPDQIGVISPYRNQINKLRKLVTKLDPNDINTVDQFQGRDKEIIIFSCVRCDNSQSVNNSNFEANNSILNDERRLNVAMTRSKKKLLIIGEKKVLNNYLPFKEFFNILTSDQRISPESKEIPIFNG